MKVDWNKKYTTIASYVLLIILATVLLVAFVWNLSGISKFLRSALSLISPFIWGFAIAYLLNRPMVHVEKRWLSFLNKKKPRERLVRSLSIGIVYLIFFSIIAGLIWVIIPAASKSVTMFVSNLPDYITDIEKWWVALTQRLGVSNFLGKMVSVETIVQNILDTFTERAPVLANAGLEFTAKAISYIGNMFICFVVGVYVLFSKERFIMQTKKVAYAIFPSKFAKGCIHLTRQTNHVFSRYLSGKLLEAFIMGVLTFATLYIAGIPYAMLIGALVGVTDLIPIFGPFIGAVPSAILLFLVDPSYAFWFIIITLILQQLGAQIIGPKIAGDSTGLTAFWVIFAIIVGGGLFGIPGMIIGIPIFAVIYSIIRQFINNRLEKKNLSTKTEDYASVKRS